MLTLPSLFSEAKVWYLTAGTCGESGDASLQPQPISPAQDWAAKSLSKPGRHDTRQATGVLSASSSSGAWGLSLAERAHLL